MAGIKDNLKAKMYAAIPGKVSSKTVVSAMELMRKQQKIRKKDYSFHISKNEEAFESHREVVQAAGGFIEDQRKYVDIWFGSCTMSFSGCEIIAVYNAFNSMEIPCSLSELIHEFEKDGMMLSGKFGTSPGAVRDYLRECGMNIKFTTFPREFDKIAEQMQTSIITIFNDVNDIRKEVHTVNVSKNEAGYLAHNVYGNGMVVGPFPSITEVIKNINEGKAKGISLIGITKK